MVLTVKKSLLDKQWIEQSGKPLRYTITDDGCMIAKQLLQINQNNVLNGVKNVVAADADSDIDIIDSGGSNDLVGTDNNTIVDIKPEFSEKTKYDILLLIDKRERGHHKDTDRSYIADQLSLYNIQCERRQIVIGDVMWIAKQHNKSDAAEYVIDCIVERKKVNDMWSSIKDGRYHEQRKRMQLSGIQRIMYIIEGNINKLSGTSAEIRRAELAVESAVASLTMVHNILVQHTPDIQHTIQSLVALTKQLQCHVDTYGLSKIKQVIDNTNNHSMDDSDTIIRSSIVYKPIEYRHFRAQCEKDSNLRITDLFNIQLRQIKGCSADRCIAIRKLYPTAHHLMDAYNECANIHDEELMLASITAGTTNAKIGDAISKRIRTFFRATSYTNNVDE